jgi:peroxiredoxin
MRLFMILVIIALVGGAVYLVSPGGPGTEYEPVAPVSIGGTAPDFELEDTQGKKVRLSDLRGKVVMLNFWATWCPPCRAEMPSMEKLNKQMAGEDFIMLAVNVEENGRAAVADFLEKSPHSFPILYDDQGLVQKLFGVYKFPESFVIRKNGIIDDKVIGAIDWGHPDTVAYFKELAKD